MLQHVYRGADLYPPGWNGKSFNNLATVTATFTHWPHMCLADCKAYEDDGVTGQMHHYRKECYNGRKDEGCQVMS